ncbi:hypothetical protein TRFO_14083 [Tritrichomonas foetus]|uniref:Uncharacterized protein n=1 Tax=Tritrichomonas foetus TaxID=1144522 RepID=A0A1J4KX53_9EUKA|nr:hypothetical protein TRFO_14083 [Tritrichomonas foetus]|eukprot:OHT15464.1 hypothetical protein TRFO_14083 [Tritrichomonas foetus]
MNSNHIFQLFEKATSSDEMQQLEFIHRITEIISVFPQSWIITKFLPFLTSWLPKNNEKVLSALISVIPQLAAASGSIALLAPLIESILISDNKEVSKQLIHPLIQCSHRNDTDLNSINQHQNSSNSSNQNPSSQNPQSSSFQLITQLTQSPYDCVRAFVPQIINLAGNDDNKRAILPSLVYDTSFRVRTASAKLIGSKISEDLACQVALTFVDDSHSRIRAFIAVVSSPRPFYVTHILPKLACDSDWSVRASVAQELVHCVDKDVSIQFCLNLASDLVWQVRLCAMRSLLKLVSISSNGTISLNGKVSQGKMSQSLASVINNPDFAKLLCETLRFQNLALKKIAIDLFLVVCPKAKNVTELILQQGIDVKLYFLTNIFQNNNSNHNFTHNINNNLTSINGNLNNNISGNLNGNLSNNMNKNRSKLIAIKLLNRNIIIDIIKETLTSEDWRNRKNIVDLFLDMAKIFNYTISQNTNNPHNEQSIQNAQSFQNFVQQLTEICIKLLDDEAKPVRQAAATQLVAFMTADGIEQNWPKYLSDFEESDRFRHRQIAIFILHLLYDKASSRQTKETIVSHINRFIDDPVDNVVEYARFVINKIE